HGDEDALKPEALTSPAGSRIGFQRRARIGVRRPPSSRQAEQHACDHAEQRSQSEDTPVHSQIERDRIASGAEKVDDSRREYVAEREPGERAERREEKPFGQKLPRQPAA